MIQATFYVLTFLIVAIQALSQKDALSPPLSIERLVPTPTEAKASDVGWESIFWGLFALAIHAMSVPSRMDTFAAKSSNIKQRQTLQQPLLYPLRFSPLICIVDALDIIIAFYVVVIHRKKPINSFASMMHAARPQENELGSNIKSRPILSLFWFLGTATQLVKIFGFEGRAIWWAKIAAGSYIGSWILITAVLLLPQNEGSIVDMDNKYLENDVLSFLNGAAIILHAGFSCYAMYQVTHLDDLFLHTGDMSNVDKKEAGHFKVILQVILVCLTGLLTLGILMGGLFDCFTFFFMMFGLAGQRSMTLRSKSFRIIAPILLLGFFAVLVIYFLNICQLIYLAANVVVQGGVLNIFIFCGLYVVNLVRHVLSRRMAFLNITEALARTELVFWFYAVTGLVTGCLYCAFAYDPTGTVKPAWLEKLA